MHKRGEGTVPAWLVTTIILILVFISILLVLRPLTSPQFALSAKEQVCRQTIAMSQTVLGSIGFKPICSTQVIPFTEKSILKRAKKGENATDAAARDILGYMQRCKDIVNGPKRTNFLSGKTCYICYSLRTDATTPYLSADNMASYAFAYRAPKGERFFFELQKDDHAIITFLPDRLEQKSRATSPQQKGITLTEDYAIAYVSFAKGSIKKILGTGAALCASSATSWLIVGPALGSAITLPVCVVSIGSAGIAALFELFEPEKKGEGAILLTDYKSLYDYGCDTVVS